MPQYLQERNSDWPRTLHGCGRLDEPPQADGPWESRFVPIGARVGRSGQVFETEGAGGAGPLVVKLFTWAAGLPEAVVQDFTREAMTVANLRHPHVVRVVDAGTLGDGTPFVVMERLAGMTLDEMAGGAALSIAEVVAILRGVGSALFAAHEAGVAHGAVRADNVFVAEPDGHGLACPKLLDFGVAKLAAAARALGRFVDEPWAPAPAHGELGRRAGERADQLALAALAWRLLGGASSPAVERALFRAMSPDPSLRFGTVTAFVAALEEASVNAPVVAVTAVRPRPVAPAAAAPAQPAPPPAPPPSSLTQQFFAAGEQLEVAHAAGRAAAAAAVAAGDEQEEDEGDEGDEVEIAAAARVPRSRAQMAIAALLALTSVAIIAGTVVSLADKPASGPVAAEAARAAAGSPSPSPQLSRWPAATAAPVAASHARRKVAVARGLPVAPVAARAAAPVAAAPPAADFPSPPSQPTPVPIAAPVPPVPAAVPAAAPPSPAAAPAAEAVAPAEAASPGAAAPAASDDDDEQPGEQAADAPPAGAPAPSPPAEAAPAAPAAP
jgi:serine/threonine-protein kinase